MAETEQGHWHDALQGWRDAFQKGREEGFVDGYRTGKLEGAALVSLAWLIVLGAVLAWCWWWR